MRSTRSRKRSSSMKNTNLFRQTPKCSTDYCLTVCTFPSKTAGWTSKGGYISFSQSKKLRKNSDSDTRKYAGFSQSWNALTLYFVNDKDKASPALFILKNFDFCFSDFLKSDYQKLLRLRQ